MLTPEYLQGLVGHDISIWKFYVLRHYDWDMSRLYNQLRQDIQTRWPDGITRFQPHERVVFVHDDLDIVLGPDSVPFTLYNLQLILRELQVSNCYCRIITNLPNYQVFCDRAAAMLVNDVAIKAVSRSFWGSCVDGAPHANTAQGYDAKIEDVTADTHSIVLPFIAQCRKTGWHRRYFMSQLWAHDLLGSGIVAYHNAAPDDPAQGNHNQGPAPGCTFLYTQPFSRNLREHVLQSRVRRHQMEQFPYDRYSANCELQDVSSSWTSSFYQHPEISKALIYVSLETTANLCRAFLTRITFKAIVYQRPFLIVGAPGCLALLRDMGFMTFSDFWDESYDQESSLEHRVTAVINTLARFRDLSGAELQQTYQAMSHITRHNYQHMRSTFVRDQQQVLIQGMK